MQEVLRDGSRKILAVAIEAEVAVFLEQHSALTTDAEKAAVVRNGYLPERTIQVGFGDIAVKVSKFRDRSGCGVGRRTKRFTGMDRSSNKTCV